MKRRLGLFILFLVPLAWFSTGCTSTITNLTPRTHYRNANNLYPFEMAWDSNQRSVREETIQPYVIIGLESYPMQPTPMVRNRWETLVPIAPDNEVVTYRYKVDYEYSAIPRPQKSSKLSPLFQLRILEPRDTP